MTFTNVTSPFLIILLLAGSASAQTTLKWKLNEGDQLNAQIEDHIAIKITANNDGQVFEMDQRVILDMTWRVGKIADEEAEIMISINRVRFQADGKGAAAGARVDLDTKDGTQPDRNPHKAIARLLESLTDEPTKIRMHLRGQVSDVVFPNAVKTLMEDNTYRELAGFFGDFFSINGLSSRLTQWPVQFPQQDISPDATWQEGTVSRVGKPFACTKSYVYKGNVEHEQKRLDQIDVKLEMAPAKDAKGNWEIVSQQSEGTCLFDNTLGRLSKSESRHRIVLESGSDIVYEVTTKVKFDDK